mgnify:CR=1 FL=1
MNIIVTGGAGFIGSNFVFHMLSPELKKLLNDLRAGESNIRIDREKIQAELETLDNTPVFLKHSLSMSTRVCPTCGREL